MKYGLSMLLSAILSKLFCFYEFDGSSTRFVSAQPSWLDASRHPVSLECFFRAHFRSTPSLPSLFLSLYFVFIPHSRASSTSRYTLPSTVPHENHVLLCIRVLTLIFFLLMTRVDIIPRNLFCQCQSCSLGVDSLFTFPILFTLTLWFLCTSRSSHFNLHIRPLLIYIYSFPHSTNCHYQRRSEFSKPSA